MSVWDEPRKRTRSVCHVFVYNLHNARAKSRVVKMLNASPCATDANGRALDRKIWMDTKFVRRSETRQLNRAWKSAPRKRDLWDGATMKVYVRGIQMKRHARLSRAFFPRSSRRIGLRAPPHAIIDTPPFPFRSEVASRADATERAIPAEIPLLRPARVEIPSAGFGTNNGSRVLSCRQHNA